MEDQSQNLDQVLKMSTFQTIFFYSLLISMVFLDCFVYQIYNSKILIKPHVTIQHCQQCHYNTPSKPKKESDENHKKFVARVTAYNPDVLSQNDNQTKLAFGSTFKIQQKFVAVSRDLEKKGLSNGTKIKIDGLSGIYIVKDRMHKKMRNCIDVAVNNYKWSLGKRLKYARNFQPKYRRIWIVKNSNKLKEIKNYD